MTLTKDTLNYKRIEKIITKAVPGRGQSKAGDSANDAKLGKVTKPNLQPRNAP